MHEEAKNDVSQQKCYYIGQSSAEVEFAQAEKKQLRPRTMRNDELLSLQLFIQVSKKNREVLVSVQTNIPIVIPIVLTFPHFSSLLHGIFSLESQLLVMKHDSNY